MKKKTRFIILFFLIIAVIMVVIKFQNKEKVNVDLPNQNNEEDFFVEQNTPVNDFMLKEPIKLEEDKKYNGLTLTNIELQMISERECEIRAVVINNKDTISEMQNIKIKTYDKDGNVLDTLGAQIDSIEPKGHTELFALVRKDNVDKITRIEIFENEI